MDPPLSQSARRGPEAEIEVRQLYEMEDFAGVDGVEQFRDLEALRG